MKKRLISLLLVSALILALAACGSTPSSESPAQNSDNASAEPEQSEAVEYVQGVSDDEILIANCIPTSGAYATVGTPMYTGLVNYLEYVNSNGGIDGRQITLIHEDDEGDSAKAISYIEQFVEDDKVFAIVEHFGTAQVGATLDYLKESGIPSVYFCTGIGQLYSDHAAINADGYNIFPVQPIYITEGQIMAVRGVGDFDAKKIGIIYSSNDAGENMMQGAETQCSTLGVEYAAVHISPGTVDVSAEVTKLLSENVDFIIIATLGTDVPTVVTELAAQGNTADCMTSYVSCSTSIADLVIPSLNEFDLYAGTWADFYSETNAEETKLYYEWVDEEYWYNAYVQCGWIAGSVFCQGLERVADSGEELTWASYMRALESEPVKNPFGGLLDYTDGKRQGTTDMTLCVVDEAQDGGWAQLTEIESMQDILNK